MNNDYIKQIERYGVTARGRTELIKYLNGEKITQRQAILANCYTCMGYYADGRNDCKLKQCPLYPFMPYSSNPYVKKVMSENNKESARKRLSEMQSKKKVK